MLEKYDRDELERNRKVRAEERVRKIEVKSWKSWKMLENVGKSLIVIRWKKDCQQRKVWTEKEKS